MQIASVWVSLCVCVCVRELGVARREDKNKGGEAAIRGRLEQRRKGEREKVQETAEKEEEKKKKKMKREAACCSPLPLALRQLLLSRLRKRCALDGAKK